MKPQDLISDEYRTILEEYHEKAKGWGMNASQKRIPFITKIVKRHGTKNILDYGAGKATLNDALPYHVTSYEPGIPKFAAMPEPHDIVVSFGAIEHVEPECIDNVLKHICELTKIRAYLDIGTLPSKHVLPDGRKAHLIVENEIWWIDRLEQAGFKIISATSNIRGDNTRINRNMGKGCIMFICEPL